jgi:hypothetical protein
MCVDPATKPAQQLVDAGAERNLRFLDADRISVQPRSEDRPFRLKSGTRSSKTPALDSFELAMSADWVNLAFCFMSAASRTPSQTQLISVRD